MASLADAYKRIRTSSAPYGGATEIDFQDLDATYSKANFHNIRQAAQNLLNNEAGYRRNVASTRNKVLPFLTLRLTQRLDVLKHKFKLQQIVASQLGNQPPDWGGAISEDCGGSSVRFWLATHRIS